MRYYARYLRERLAASTALAFFSVLTAGFEATALITLVPLTQLATGAEERIHVDQLPVIEPSLDFTAMALVTVGLVVGRFVANLCAAWLQASLSADYIRTTRLQLAASHLNADWAMLARERAGDLQDLTVQQLNRATNGLQGLLVGFVGLVSLLGMLTGALLIDPLGALSIIVAAAILLTALNPITRLAKRSSRRQSRLNRELSHRISETVSLSREIRVFDTSGPVLDWLQELVDKDRRFRFIQSLSTLIAPFTFMSGALLMIVGGLVAVRLLELDELTGLAAMVILLVRAMGYGRVVQGTYHRVNIALPYAEAVNTRIEELAEHQLSGGGAPLQRIDTVRFAQVSFAYESDVPVLHEVSFELERGELVGIVGPSGAGKSTFVQLLLRLRDPNAGQILVNGTPVTEIDVHQWYGRVGYVPQEPVLLNSSVEDNIRFFREDLNRDAIRHAAELANIHDEIMSWPAGYETSVGERGAEVSGGQRQRICIARALARQPDLIVMDEPTSALDAHSEHAIQASLEGLRRSTIVFIIAHRLSTLSGCDRLMVFRNGWLEAFAAAGELRGDVASYLDEISQLSLSTQQR